MIKKIQAVILKWYYDNGRKLPWRATKKPYTIWLSEIIMQQTRIEQGSPYFENFIESYPTVFELVKATEDEVLKLWQGLGYYSRARNMHHTAKIIVKDYAGKFPETYKELVSLKGIGDYTACAILSICFDKPYAVVDGNVFRVLSRVFGIEELIDSTKGKKIFQVKANELLDRLNPGDFNQAMMDFGAMQCIPQNPVCNKCPLANNCIAFQKKIQNQLPNKSSAKKLKKRYFHYLFIENEDRFYIRKRKQKDIWQNLYDLPLIEKSKSAKITMKEIEDYLGLKIEQVEIQSSVKHILSHQELTINFYFIRNCILTDQMNLRSIEKSEMVHYAFPKPVLEFLQKIGS